MIYITLCEEGNVQPMSHYEFWRLVYLEKIEPKNFGVRNNMVSAVKQRGIRKMMGLHLLLLFQHGRR